jgi:hypothetical protein
VVLAGPGLELWSGRAEFARSAEGLSLRPFPARRREFLGWLRGLLAATAARPGQYACFGLHEWAMVYRQAPDERRHMSQPLRLEPEALARVVETTPLRCTHFDAYRFFTPEARPLNRLALRRELAPEHEQPACVHANMDLYKWAYKLAPWTPGELMADCFALARELRELDMRASPYDLRALGYAPIAIETSEGRAEYETRQRELAAAARPLRARLLALCEELLASEPEAPETSSEI